MAAARSQAPATPSEPEPTDEPQVTAPEPTEGAELEKAPTAFEYTWGDPTQYSHVPLTAYPARPAEPAVKGDGGVVVRDAMPARPATVFAFVEPPDGRWRPTDLPVNQARDNEAPIVKGA